MVKVSKLQRKNGYWYVRYWIGGKVNEESTRSKSEVKAEGVRVKRELELNAGIQPLCHADLSHLISEYLGSLPPSTSTSHRHESARILQGFLQICGRKRRESFKLRTEQITPALIDRYINQRQQTDLHVGELKDKRGRKIVRKRPVSNVTLRKELRYLSAFFNWCCKQRPPYLRENPIPLSRASQVKNDTKPHFMITKPELESLLKACKTKRQYLFLLLGWWTGGRRSEILGLHYYHFDFAARTVMIKHPKNSTHSLLPVSVTIIQLVQELYKEASESDRVFPTDPYPSHSFGKVCRDAGIRHHRFHDFRISTSMAIKSGGFDASLAGLWVGNQANTNRAHYTDLTGVATQISSLLELSDLPPVPSQTT